MTIMTIELQTPTCFKPLDQAARYKASYGGRGSGKSWHFASMVVERCLLRPGSRVVCVDAFRPGAGQENRHAIRLAAARKTYLQTIHLTGGDMADIGKISAHGMLLKADPCSCHFSTQAQLRS